MQVLGNGDVRLSWISPPDPGGTFHSYEVFTSTLATGPFTALTPAVTSLSTNTFVHTFGTGGQTANNTSWYYYVVTRSGSGGTMVSKPSDTLRSIFVNVQTVVIAEAKEVKYSPLHEPKLPSSINTYTVEKEYPIGTWSAIRILSGLSTYDTLSVCRDSLNYRVLLQDVSGCRSESNVQGGLYIDTRYPGKPVIDSISVLPNGNTVLAWRIPPLDKDVVRYEIQYKNTATTFTTIALVSGRNSTSYTYANTFANSNTVSISVAAIDSCDKSSTVNYDVSTMFLKTEYDSCAHTTKLSWNDYPFMLQGILEYRIFYSTNGVDFKQVGKSTTPAFTHLSVDGANTVTYFIRVLNKDTSITASSNRVSFFTAQAPIPDYLYIKSVSAIDKKTNRVNILIDTSKDSRGIDILRSEDSTNFETIGFVPYAGSPNIIFNDEKAEPGKKSYYYKVGLRDACGNLRSLSNRVKTILLKVKEDSDNLFLQHLSWTSYEGFAAGVKEYQVYRVVDDVVEQAAIGNTNTLTTLFTDNLEDLAPKGTRIEYFVQAQEDAGNPYGLREQSNSNAVDVYIEGRLFVPNAFVPGGTNKVWRPVTHFIDKNDYRVSVFNRWGKMIFQTTSDEEAWDGAGAPPDVYVYVINFKNSRGEYKEISGTVNLIK